MKILGVNGTLNLVHEEIFGFSHEALHDSSATLVIDGRVVAAFEEERLDRIKHSNKFPILGIRQCLSTAGLVLHDIDYIVLGVGEENSNTFLIESYLKRGIERKYWCDIRSYIQKLLFDEFHINYPLSKFQFYNHHYAHAASSYFISGLKDSLALTLDGYGETESGAVYKCHDNVLTALTSFSKEQSLGHLYGMVTMDVLGFSPFSEYKVMGLAPYGDPARFSNAFTKNYQLLPQGNYSLDKEAIRAALKAIVQQNGSDIRPSQVDKDIAAALQEALEIIVFHILSHYKQATNTSNLCFAGGVSLNATLNGKLASSNLFDSLSIFSAANDSGVSTGLALACYFDKVPHATHAVLDDVFLGTGYWNNDIEELRIKDWTGLIEYEKMDDVAGTTAELLAQNNVIGWVQGRSEFGPRALGNRSILADPRPAANKARINRMIKKREAFRPFAPSVMEEYAKEYFELPSTMSRFPDMLFVFPVQQKYRALLGAVTHVDGSARIQTVSPKHERYYKLLEEFKKRTGIPILLNTSFNNNAEPIVNNVDDAIVCYLTTELNYLVVGDFLLKKRRFSSEDVGSLFMRLHESNRLVAATELQDVNGTGSYFIVNSYNDQRIEVPLPVARVLSQANGKYKLNEIIDQLDLRQQSNSLIEKIFDLWCRRVVVLSPTSFISKTCTLVNQLDFDTSNTTDNFDVKSMERFLG